MAIGKPIPRRAEDRRNRACIPSNSRHLHLFWAWSAESSYGGLRPRLGLFSAQLCVIRITAASDSAKLSQGKQRWSGLATGPGIRLGRSSRRRAVLQDSVRASKSGGPRRAKPWNRSTMRNEDNLFETLQSAGMGETPGASFKAICGASAAASSQLRTSGSACRIASSPTAISSSARLKSS
jgi:hypothetical protein